MRIALRHDRRFMPEQPLDLVQVHPCLHHSCGARMPKIMEMKVRDLHLVQQEPHTSADVVAIEPCLPLAGKHPVRLGMTEGVFLFQQVECRAIERDRASLTVLGLEHRGRAPKQIHPRPRQAKNFSPPHAGMKGKEHQLSQPRSRCVRAAAVLRPRLTSDPACCVPAPWTRGRPGYPYTTPTHAVPG